MKTGADEGGVTKLVALLRDIPDQMRRLIIALFALSGLLLVATPAYALWTARNQVAPAPDLPKGGDRAVAEAVVLDTAGTHISTATGAALGQAQFVLGMDEPASRLAPAQVARLSLLVEPHWLGEQGVPAHLPRSSSPCRFAASAARARCSVWVVHDDYDGAPAATTDLAAPQAAHVYRFDRTLPSNMESTWLPWIVIEIACGLLLLVYAYEHAPRVKAAMRLVGKSLGLIDTAPAVRHERGG